MVKFVKNKVIILASAFLLSNCITGQVGNPSVTLFVNEGNIGLTGQSVSPNDKFGIACATTYLAMIAVGDASIQEACKKGNINRITSVNLFVKENDPFTQEVCTQVWGN